MLRIGKTHNGKYGAMKNLYNAYESNNNNFGCEITLMKLYRVSRIPERWELKVEYKAKDETNRKKFDYEVDMTYDLYYNKTHAILYYSRK